MAPPTFPVDFISHRKWEGAREIGMIHISGSTENMPALGLGPPGLQLGEGVAVIIQWEKSVEGCSLEKVWKRVLLRVHTGPLGKVEPLGREKKPFPPSPSSAQAPQVPTISSSASVRSPLRLLCR